MPTVKNIAGIAATIALAVGAQAAHAQALGGWADSASLEFGTNPQQRMLRVAVQNDWDQRWFARNGYHLSGYWETNLALWRLRAYQNVPGRTKNIAVVVPNDFANGPDDYKISPDAEVTVLIYKGGKVAANHALAKGALNKDSIKKIIADTATILN